MPNQSSGSSALFISFRVRNLWKNTQVRFKGTVLKTVRSVKRRMGSNPISSFYDTSTHDVHPLQSIKLDRSRIHVTVIQNLPAGYSIIPTTEML